MSGIAGLFNVAGTQEELSTWSFVHAAHHVDINRVVYQIFGETLDGFILDPFNPADADDWLQNHQQMHQQMDDLLGVSGYNLLNIDMNDRKEFSGWVFLNADEHFKIANILGIG